MYMVSVGLLVLLVIVMFCPPPPPPPPEGALDDAKSVATLLAEIAGSVSCVLLTTIAGDAHGFVGVMLLALKVPPDKVVEQEYHCPAFCTYSANVLAVLQEAGNVNGLLV